MGKLITTSLGHYYEVKASIISQDKDGVVKRVRTALVTDAASFGDAEETALKVLGEDSPEPQILAITPASYNEVYAGQFCERFFKVKRQADGLFRRQGEGSEHLLSCRCSRHQRGKEHRQVFL